FSLEWPSNCSLNRCNWPAWVSRPHRVRRAPCSNTSFIPTPPRLLRGFTRWSSRMCPGSRTRTAPLWHISFNFVDHSKKKMFYELAASTWGQEEIDAIRRTIETGRFTMGEQVAAFEQEFANYFGMRYGVMANSGSSANLIAVASLF